MRIRIDPKSLVKGLRRLEFYFSNFLSYYTPNIIYCWIFRLRIKKLSSADKNEVEKRAEYYCRLPQGASIDTNESLQIGNFKYPFGQKKKYATYFFDLYKYMRLFPKDKRFVRIFGDIETSICTPAIVKARQISPNVSNGVLMKLNSVRHFQFVDDKKSFTEKDFKLIFRNVVNKQPWRLHLLELYHQHPLCDFGRINHLDDGHPEFTKPFIPINEQLNNKFILCIEGHDVATNLKWVMSSNSIAVMPRPKMESWFMEGTLIPDYHYIEIKDDYSDLIEKVTYYATNPKEAEAIIAHAHEHVAKFQNKKQEDYCSYLVLKKYFEEIGVKE